MINDNNKKSDYCDSILVELFHERNLHQLFKYLCYKCNILKIENLSINFFSPSNTRKVYLIQYCHSFRPSITTFPQHNWTADILIADESTLSTCYYKYILHVTENFKSMSFIF